MHNRSFNLIKFFARVISLLWAVFWLVLGIMTGPEAEITGFFFLVCVIIAWRWELWGGIILIIQGLFWLISISILSNEWESGLFRNPILNSFIFTLYFPALASGTMFIIDSRKKNIQKQ